MTRNNGYLLPTHHLINQWFWVQDHPFQAWEATLDYIWHRHIYFFHWGLVMWLQSPTTLSIVMWNDLMSTVPRLLPLYLSSSPLPSPLPF